VSIEGGAVRGPEEVLQFWFDEIAPAKWWARDAAFDQLIAERFGPTHAAAARCELHAWRARPDGRLAEIIVLDQFSRNLHRDDARAYALDPLALALAQEAVRSGADRAVARGRRAFLYMPYMHSESAPIHALAIELFTALGDAANLDSERRHKSIIERFGRYPHRNRILGRPSTPEEVGFLAQPGSSF
jgi:uncharacterized protein (DUF924 family)